VILNNQQVEHFTLKIRYQIATRSSASGLAALTVFGILFMHGSMMGLFGRVMAVAWPPSREIAFSLKNVLTLPHQFPTAFHHQNHFSVHFRILLAINFAIHSNSMDCPHPL
jgi:hypothetical protein